MDVKGVKSTLCTLSQKKCPQEPGKDANKDLQTFEYQPSSPESDTHTQERVAALSSCVALDTLGRDFTRWSELDRLVGLLALTEHRPSSRFALHLWHAPLPWYRLAGYLALAHGCLALWCCLACELLLSAAWHSLLPLGLSAFPPELIVCRSLGREPREQPSTSCFTTRRTVRPQDWRLSAESCPRLLSCMRREQFMRDWR